MLVFTYDQGSKHRDLPVSSAGASTVDRSHTVLVKVSGIPRGMSEEMVRMMFENKRYGGGDIKMLEFCRSDDTAVIEFESSAGNIVFRSLIITFV